MQPPDGVPDECPFQVDWKPACVAVQLAPGIDEFAIKSTLVESHEFKCVHLLLEANNVEAGADASPLKDALVKARAEGGEGYVPPAELAIQLLERRYASDREQGWKIEWERRQALAAERTTQHQVSYAATDHGRTSPHGSLCYLGTFTPMWTHKG